MTKQSPIIKILYFILFRLMDLESILWDISEALIWPIAKTRGFIVRKIAKLLNIEEKTNDK